LTGLYLHGFSILPDKKFILLYVMTH